MPTYKNPTTGEEIEQSGDGQTEFYLSRGWVLVSNAPAETVTFDAGLLKSTDVIDFDAVVKGKGKNAAD